MSNKTKSPREYMRILVPKETHQKVKALAALKGISMSKLLRQWVESDFSNLFKDEQ